MSFWLARLFHVARRLHTPTAFPHRRTQTNVPRDRLSEVLYLIPSPCFRRVTDSQCNQSPTGVQSTRSRHHFVCVLSTKLLPVSSHPDTTWRRRPLRSGWQRHRLRSSCLTNCCLRKPSETSLYWELEELKLCRPYLSPRPQTLGPIGPSPTVPDPTS